MQPKTVKTVLVVLLLVIYTGASGQFSANSAQANNITTSATAGGFDWTNPSNALTADNVFATSSITSTSKPTYNLDMMGWGFQKTNSALSNYIPPNATINGIQISIRLRKTGSGNIRDSKIILLKAGAETGINKARGGATWPTVAGTIVFGSSTDAWGAAWTTDDLINTNFGLRIVGKTKGNKSAQAEIDYVSIKLYFNLTFYFSKSTGDLSTTTTWGLNRDGSGTNPSNFTNDGQIFCLRNRTSASLISALTISGLTSKMVVGDSVTALTFTIPASTSLTGMVDVYPLSSLVVTNEQGLIIGILSDNTTVTYNSTSAQGVYGTTYYNLILSGSGTKTLQTSAMGSSVVNNVLTINSGITFNNQGNNMQVLGAVSGIANNGTVTGSGTVTYSLLDVSTNITGTGQYSNLEIDASTSSATRSLTLANPTTISGTLTLSDGNFVNGTNLSLSNGSTIALSDGSLASSISGASGYHVTYLPFTGTSKTTDNELTGTLQNFTVQTTTGTVLLNKNLVAAGNFLLASGSLDPTTSPYNITIGGNYTNNATLVARNNLFTFNGSTLQTINGTAPQNFYDFTINQSNVGTVQLNTPVQVTHSLNLTQGLVATSATNSFTLSAAATFSGGSSNSFINGPLVHTVNTTATTSKIFPIGKSTSYRPAMLTVTQSSAASTTYTAEVFNTAPPTRNFPSTIDYVSTTRYWKASSSNPGILSAAAMRLTYGPDDGVFDASNTRMVGSNASNWVDLGGTASSVSSGFITSTNSFNTLGDFAIARNANFSSVLAGNFLSFMATHTGGTIDLKWEAVEEQANQLKYTLQKSTDGLHWKALAQQQSQNRAKNIYHHTDVQPSRINYYRVRREDVHGKTDYSKVSIIKLDAGNAVQIYPGSVVGNALHCQIKNNDLLLSEKVIVSVMDMSGRVLYTNTMHPEAVLNINPGYLPKGKYLLLVQSEKGLHKTSFTSLQ